MKSYTIIFSMFAAVFAVIGFGNINRASAPLAQILFVLFLIFAVLSWAVSSKSK